MSVPEPDAWLLSGACAGKEPRNQDRGSIALLMTVTGTVMLLLLTLFVGAIADVMTARARAQTAADASALAAMATSPLVGGAGAARDAADRMARANGARVADCCGEGIMRVEVAVAVALRASYAAGVLPPVVARAAAAVEPTGFADPREQALPDTLPGAAGAGRVWPVRGRLTSGFGPRVHPIYGDRRMHTGIDLAAVSGTPVVAAATGEVVFAGARGGYGLTIDIRHPDRVVTRYAHLSRLGVTVGQQVAPGRPIGAVGSTGTSTGPHLHFEARVNDRPTNPLAWLGQP